MFQKVEKLCPVFKLCHQVELEVQALSAMLAWRFWFDHNNDFDGIALSSNGIEFMAIGTKSSENEEFMQRSLFAHTSEIVAIVPWIGQNFLIVLTTMDVSTRRPIARALFSVIRLFVWAFENGILATEMALNVFLAIRWMRIAANFAARPTRRNLAWSIWFLQVVMVSNSGS